MARHKKGDTGSGCTGIVLLILVLGVIRVCSSPFSSTNTETPRPRATATVRMVVANPTSTLRISATPDTVEPTVTKQANFEVIIHIVQPGDTLGEIALEYDVTVSAIVETNNINDPNRIRVGDELIIPVNNNSQGSLTGEPLQVRATNTSAPLPNPTPLPAPTATRRAPTKVPSSSGNCHSSYPTVCIPPPPPDLDCGEIGFRRFQVVGSDPHGFDRDNDGVGCES